MIVATFATPQRFVAEDRLRDAFGCEHLFLADGAELLVTGRITLAPQIFFAGACSLDDGTIVETGSILTDVRLGRENRVRPHSILTAVDAGARNLFGPFCFLRDGCAVGDDCILGAHVEAARSRFADGVKISHRAFVGDADIGQRSIVGAGVVFCNWDGERRQPTMIGADVTLGSGTLIVPPLTVGDGALIAAGSTVTGDVAPGARLMQKRG